MQELAERVSMFLEGIPGVGTGVAGFLLKLLVAAVVFTGGWYVAALCRRVILHILRGAGRIGNRLTGITGSADPRFAGAAINVVGALVFWGVVAMFVAFVGQLLDVALIDRGIEALIAYLPALGSGILVILAGTVISGLALPVVVRSAESAGFAHTHLLGRITQAVILIATAVIAATQFGLDVSFLTNIALVLLAAIVGGFALGLALGTPTHLTNIIGARNVRDFLKPGDRVRIDSFEGTVAEIGQTHVLLESEAGEIAVPAGLFSEKACTILHEDADGRG